MSEHFPGNWREGEERNETLSKAISVLLICRDASSASSLQISLILVLIVLAAF